MITISHTICSPSPLTRNSYLRRTRTHKIQASKTSYPAPMTGFPYLPPPQKDLMNELISSIEASVGSTLLPSQVAADVLHYQNDAGTSQGSLDIRPGSPNSTIDFTLTSWLHRKLPSGHLNITTILAYLNATTDAPHLLIEFIQGTPTSLILLLDLVPRKDSVLHPEYLDEYYNNTVLDKVRQDLEELPQISPYRSPSLYIRSVFSPTAVVVRVDCESEGDLEEIVGKSVGRSCKEVLGVWMSKCAGKVKETGDGEKDVMVRRDGLIKKMLETDLVVNLPRLFGDDIAGRFVGEIKKAYGVKYCVLLKASEKVLPNTISRCRRYLRQRFVVLGSTFSGAFSNTHHLWTGK